MNATLVVSIVLTVCAGLAGLAIKQPAIYAKMHQPLKYAMWVVYLMVGVYLISLSVAYTALLPMISPDKFAAAQEAIDRMGVSQPWYILGSFIAWAYVTFIGWLAGEVLERQDDDQRKKDDD